MWKNDPALCIRRVKIVQISVRKLIPVLSSRGFVQSRAQSIDRIDLMGCIRLSRYITWSATFRFARFSVNNNSSDHGS